MTRPLTSYTVQLFTKVKCVVCVYISMYNILTFLKTIDVRHEKFNILTLMNYPAISIFVFYTLKTKYWTIRQSSLYQQYCIMIGSCVVCFEWVLLIYLIFSFIIRVRKGTQTILSERSDSIYLTSYMNFNWLSVLCPYQFSWQYSLMEWLQRKCKFSQSLLKSATTKLWSEASYGKWP